MKSLKRHFHFLLLVFLVFGMPQVLHAQYKALFEPDVPPLIEISMSGKQMAAYHQKISDIYHDRDMFITDKYKDWFKIYIKHPDGVGMFAAKAKVVGEWKDHIVLGKNTSRASIKISLKKGNIGGITSFRLLLPQTRNGMAEVFWSTLMEKLGYPTLYTRRVQVSVNGLKYAAIFQEVPEKEFLERFAIRESPIIDSDDRQRRYDRLYLQKQGDTKGKDPRNYRGKINNKGFLKNTVSNSITMKGIHAFLEEFSLIQAENAKFFDAINHTYGNHGLIWHNLKYIFDPIYNRLIPVYWDGNISLRSPKSLCNREKN
ncbi:MAG: hypothetical protein R3A45_03555 [Bdellovibrionota bacterium]